MIYKILKTREYLDWYNQERMKSKAQIEERLIKIINDGYFGHNRHLSSDLYELKFNDGRRIYYTIIPVNKMILLLGGNKNGQDKDITKAKNIIKKAKERIES